MINLPAQILDLLYSVVLDKYSPAYLLVSRNGHLLKAGGKLAAYGIPPLVGGKTVGEQIYFLEGLLPHSGAPEYIPRLTLESGLAADLYLFSDDEGDWAVMLDATAEKIEIGRTQQRANELSLLRERAAQVSTSPSAENELASYNSTLTQQAQQYAAAGELRDVTIVLGRLSGVDALIKQHGPEVVLQTMDVYLENLTNEILKENGQVFRSGGNELLAVFTGPANDLSAQAAIRSAFGMDLAVAALNHARQVDNQGRLGFSASVSSGPAVVSSSGRGERRTIKLVGGPLTTATALVGAADERQLIIDGETLALSGELSNKFYSNKITLEGMAVAGEAFFCKME